MTTGRCIITGAVPAEDGPHGDLQTLDPASLKEAVLTEGEHAFHEGAFLVKRGGTYTFVYTGISRADGAWTLEYAQSGSPFGPYRYGGVILDNRGCNPNN